MRKLADIQTADLLTKGLFPDMPKNQAQLFRSAKNVEFGNSRAYHSVGYTNEDAPGDVIYALAQAYIEGLRKAYYATEDKLFAYFNGARAEIGSGFGGLGYWSLVPWGSWLIATNDFDAVQVYKNVDTAVPLANVRIARARLAKKNNNHVLLYYGQSVDWSSDSNPELWLPDDDNTAGRQLIRDLDSDIVAVSELSGNSMGVYSFDRFVPQTFTGDPFIFTFGQSIEGIGALSDSAVISQGNKNFGLGPKGFWATDGISYDYIDRPEIREFVFGKNGQEGLINLDERRRVVGLHDGFRDQIKWWFKCNDDVIRGVSYNYKGGAWGILEQSVTAALRQEVFDHPLIGAGNLFGFNSGVTLGDAAMPTELITFPFHANVRESFKLWDLMRADFEGAGLEVRFGFSDDPADDPEFTAWGLLNRDNFIDRESVFLTIEFRSTGTEDWALTGASFHGEITGDNT